jgi:hypothetical protein
MRPKEHFFRHNVCKGPKIRHRATSRERQGRSNSAARVRPPPDVTAGRHVRRKNALHVI